MYVVISKIYSGFECSNRPECVGCQWCPVAPIIRARHTKAVHGKMSFKITCKYDSQYILKKRLELLHMVFDGCSLTPKMHLAIVDL